MPQAVFDEPREPMCIYLDSESWVAMMNCDKLRSRHHGYAYCDLPVFRCDSDEYHCYVRPKAT